MSHNAVCTGLSTRTVLQSDCCGKWICRLYWVTGEKTFVEWALSVWVWRSRWNGLNRSSWVGTSLLLSLYLIVEYEIYWTVISFRSLQKILPTDVWSSNLFNSTTTGDINGLFSYCENLGIWSSWYGFGFILISWLVFEPHSLGKSVQKDEILLLSIRICPFSALLNIWKNTLPGGGFRSQITQPTWTYGVGQVKSTNFLNTAPQNL